LQTAKNLKQTDAIDAEAEKSLCFRQNMIYL